MGFFNNYYAKNVSIGNNVKYVNNSCAELFKNCGQFNQPFTIQDGIVNTTSMFSECTFLNSKISIPNSVTHMGSMFYNCTSFNQPVTLSSSASSTAAMFSGCSKFNQTVVIPNNVTNMNEMFYNCINFNRPVTMPSNFFMINGMFNNCVNFNQSVTIPNYSYNSIYAGIYGLQYMFANCRKFNKPITIPVGVCNISNMFLNALNMASNVTILSTTVNNVVNMFSGAARTCRINVIVPAGSTTNTTFFKANSYPGLMGTSFTWTKTNTYAYNSTYNIYLYWV